jgi:hypothetical protein
LAPLQGGPPLGPSRNTFGLLPQVAACHAPELSRAVMRRSMSSYAMPAFTLKARSPQVKLKRPPWVEVSRNSSCWFTRPPSQMKLAGLPRSTFERIDGTSPLV